MISTRQKRNVKYTDEPMGEIKIIADFLPGPEHIVFKEDTIKVTLSLMLILIRLRQKPRGLLSSGRVRSIEIRAFLKILQIIDSCDLVWV